MPTAPEFLLRKLFVPGSLRRYPDGFSFQLNNSLASVNVSALALEVDGEKIDAARVTIQADESPARSAASLSVEQPFALSLHQAVTVRVVTSQYRPRRLRIRAETLEAGALQFSIDPNPQAKTQSKTTWLRTAWQAWQQKRRQGRVRKDPHHPRYHFTPPANWVNDPNGLIVWEGKTHLFYQHNPLAPTWGSMHWGHAVSHDLAHWRRLPIALAPTPGSADADGCWSGCAVNDHGIPTLLYTGVFPESVCLARGSRDLLHWEKHPANPVIPAPPPNLTVEGFRDPCVWREGEWWYMILGSGLRGQGGCILLYRSADLLTWEFLQVALVGDLSQKEPIWSGSMWECPQLFALDGQSFLVFSVCHASQLHYTAVFQGDFRDGRFHARSLAKFDHGNRAFYAPQTFVDAAGRRLMFGWVMEERSEAALKKAGWAGAISLPRLLSLGEKGELCVDAAPETAALRGREESLSNLALTANPQALLTNLDALHLEMEAVLEASEGKTVLLLATDPQAPEQTRLAYDAGAHTLEVDTRRSSRDPEAQGSLKTCALSVQPGEKLRLHLFVDGSILELFVNQTAVLTTRFYPQNVKGLRWWAFCEGSASLESLRGWEMQPCIAED